VEFQRFESYNKRKLVMLLYNQLLSFIKHYLTCIKGTGITTVYSGQYNKFTAKYKFESVTQ